MQPEGSTEEKTLMKVGVITLMTALLFALPAWAGSDPCTGHDSDSDGELETCDNCDVVANAAQTDADSDGFGNACDCDYDNNNLCDGTDFLTLGSLFGQTVPPAPPDVDQDDSLIIDGPDFLALGGGFGQPPGSSCGNAKGIPCPHQP
jgi:hypothetical protein